MKLKTIALGLMGLTSITLFAQEKGWKSPFLESKKTATHMEPSLIHSAWESEADKKLTQLEKKYKRKPNIVIFVVDDMGWGDPGCYGGGAAIGAPTPVMDRLAQNGLMLTSAYSQPSCTPTRGALLTGRLPQRSGYTRPTAAGEDVKETSEIFIAKLLSEGGYHTGMAGKWHLGETKGSVPTDLGGFDEYYGNLGVNTVYHDFRDAEITPEIANRPEYMEKMMQVDFVRSTVKGNKGEDLVELEEITLETEPLLEEKYLAWSQAFIKNSVDEGKPFFLYHAMNRVHTKNYPNPKFKGKSPGATPYKDGILEVDYTLGELIKTLEETGQLENTLVFITSDNGAEEDVMAGGIFTSDAGHHPWRGGKGTTWEGGVRVSAIAYWPGTIESGRVSDGLFDLMDLFNTSAKIAGIEDKIPNDRYIDGVDQTSFLLTSEDDNHVSNREVVYFWYGQHFYGARWKMIKRMENVMTVGMNPGPSTFGGLFNSTRQETTDPTLGWYFNLYRDPKERIPYTPTWAIAPLVEASVKHKMTFLQYPQAPNGIYLGGYILGGPAGGTVSKEVLEKMMITTGSGR